MVFCENIDCKQLPPTFHKPISNATVIGIETFEEMNFPLFITFINGTNGKHTLSIKVITPTRTISVPDYVFSWRGGVTQGEILNVNFQPDIGGMYEFKATIDNEFSHSVKIPFIAQSR